MRRRDWTATTTALLGATILGASSKITGAAEPVDRHSMQGKVMCGYQGWFRCPGDAAGEGWVHWSRDSRQITPETLTFEMWPEMSEYGVDERFRAGDFTYPDKQPAELFSSVHPATVLRHFTWMQDYGIDGAWLQHFVVDLPGGPAESRYASRRRVLENVRRAAAKTGRVWCLAFDVAGMPGDKVYDVLTREWRRLVEEGVTGDDRYLRHKDCPVVKIWGFYNNASGNHLSAETSLKLIDFFHQEGDTRATLFGGGDWDWRANADMVWNKVYRRLDGYMPWNVGNYWKDDHGVTHATTSPWDEDRRELEKHDVEWIPVVYPGFRWDNLKRLPVGRSEIPRRGGAFLWEQLHLAASMKASALYVAMFDEVDEGTAIFKVRDIPPRQVSLLGLEGLPSDWYLRLVGEGGRMLRGERPLSTTIPIQP